MRFRASDCKIVNYTSVDMRADSVNKNDGIARNIRAALVYGKVFGKSIVKICAWLSANFLCDCVLRACGGGSFCLSWGDERSELSGSYSAKL